MALATVADVAPLRGENRVLSDRPQDAGGDTNIVDACFVSEQPVSMVTADRRRSASYSLQRLNAAGRLGHAIRGVELLMTKTSMRRMQSPAS